MSAELSPTDGATDLSYAAGPTDAPLLEETIGANLAATVARFGDREALVDAAAGRSWTYAQLQADVDAVAQGLLRHGVRPGDRVGIWAPNCAEWVLTQYATALIGAVMVTVNPTYREHELRYVVNQSGMSLLISAVRHRRADYQGTLERVRGECPRLREVVYIGSPGWAELLDSGRDGDPRQLTDLSSGLRPDDPINIQYTSGTTGFAKGATLSHRNILNNGYAVGELLGYTSADRVCLPVPLYHCFGMVMGMLAVTSHGACAVLPAPTFAPDSTLRTVAERRCTSLYGVPTMFIAELALPDFSSYDLSSLRTGIMAGAPCPAEVMRRVIGEMNMSEVAICYGMTETSPVSTMTRADDPPARRTDTVGTVLPHLEIAIVNPVTGAVLPRGEPGEFRTRGYSVMLGYWEDPDRTAEAVDAEGWMHTGDLAVMDTEGYVSVVGRIKDMVIRGGENVYPREVEEFLHGHPDVADVQVIGVPDQRYGEELMAWVVPRAGAEPMTAEKLREYCAGRLAHYKIPRYVHVVDGFPLTVSGKVRKVEMREAAIDVLGLHDVGASSR